MIKKLIKASELKDGDIFYVNSECFIEDNEHLFDHDMVLMTGHSSIFIVDEVMVDGEVEVLVNGGHLVLLTPDSKVYILGHYSEILDDLELIS